MLVSSGWLRSVHARIECLLSREQVSPCGNGEGAMPVDMNEDGHASEKECTCYPVRGIRDGGCGSFTEKRRNEVFWAIQLPV